MVNLIIALFVAVAGSVNDTLPACEGIENQAQALEVAFGVDLTVYEDCSVEVVDN